MPQISPEISSFPWSDILVRGESEDLIATRTKELSQNAATEPLPAALAPKVRDALTASGIDSLYTHQAEAYENVFVGPTIITTGTASGKSLCFQLPTLDLLAKDRGARALYLYPTKALAQDQARSLHKFGMPNVRPAIYDGDTPQNERSAIRKNANVVLTNPDMLNVGILPHHRSWADLFSNLGLVVIDEAHVYRGVFGSHVSDTLRRLRRIANAYGTTPRFVLTSATIANPVELAESLTGIEDFRLVDRDGSPRAEREIVMWNPPLLDEKLGDRRSALQEAADLFVELIEREIKTICFIKSRKAVELIHRFAAERLQDTSPKLAKRVAPYRAGYTPQQRRDLENKLVSGELLGVVATDALELGIDIGALDAAICVTFPGTVASLRQMWGRAGREKSGLAVYIAGQDALDQFFCRHPEQFLERPVESAILDHANPQILDAHLLAAAFEGPIEETDATYFGSTALDGGRNRLTRAGALVERRGRYVLNRGEDYPAARIALRSASSNSVAVISSETGEMIGTVEAARAPTTVHEGAIYIHLGESYEVDALDLDRGRALVSKYRGDWYTQPKKETDTWIDRVETRRESSGVALYYGDVKVTEQVLGYQRKDITTNQALDLVPLLMPPTEFRTQALWYELDERLLDSELPVNDLLGALHAVEHGQIAVLPLLAMCDRWDIGGLSTNAHPQTGNPTIFIYDGHPGGVGITRRGYDRFDQLVHDAYQLISECPCKSGCPSCVQSPKCGNLNEPLSKNGATSLLKAMLTER